MTCWLVLLPAPMETCCFRCCMQAACLLHACGMSNPAVMQGPSKVLAEMILLRLQVTQRTQRQRDPRMRALQEPSDVQSLWVGDVSNYKWGGKQPVRRRRGDVHDDISAMVLHMDWSGENTAMSHGGLVWPDLWGMAGFLGGLNICSCCLRAWNRG